jgi:hypothetical protein
MGFVLVTFLELALSAAYDRLGTYLTIPTSPNNTTTPKAIKEVE